MFLPTSKMRAEASPSVPSDFCTSPTTRAALSRRSPTAFCESATRCETSSRRRFISPVRRSSDWPIWPRSPSSCCCIMPSAASGSAGGRRDAFQAK
jgi:hypothetical protein